MEVILHLRSQSWQEEVERPSSFILSPLKFFLHKISSGIQRCEGQRKRKTHQSEAVNLCSGPQMDPRLSDMLNRSTLYLLRLFPPTPHLFWRSLPSICYLSSWKKKKKSLHPTLLKTHYLVRSLWEVPPESRTSGSQRQMMSRLALTQSPSHREFLREVGRALFSLPVPPWHLPAGGSLGEPFEEAPAQSMEDLAQQIQMPDRASRGWGGWRGELGPPACTFNCLKIHFPYSLLRHRGASLCHSED